uniref:Uncharacterized protein n=1 Tax=Anopheles albimanus TaxID=7167 RepID=A0A182FXT9_ANOAL
MAVGRLPRAQSSTIRYDVVVVFTYRGPLSQC